MTSAETSQGGGRRSWRVIAAALFLVLVVVGVGLVACSSVTPKATMKVPGVTGLNYAEAQRVLSDAGFHVLVDQQTAPGQKALSVLKQTPAEGTEAKKGSDVTITVAGPAPKP